METMSVTSTVLELIKFGINDMKKATIVVRYAAAAKEAAALPVPVLLEANNDPKKTIINRENSTRGMKIGTISEVYWNRVWIPSLVFTTSFTSG